METRTISASPPIIAPDGSRIYEGVAQARGSLALCVLPVGVTAAAVVHRTVDENWWCVAGLGQLWRRSAEAETEEDLLPGKSVAIPVGTAFQFRNTGHEALVLLISTMPRWPGAEEAQRVADHWPLPASRD